MAAMSPRLGILNNIPFAIPFEVRVSIFQNFVLNDMASSRSVQSYNRFLGLGGPNGKERIKVRREMVSQDGFDMLAEVDLKAPIEIAFIDQFGQEERVAFFYISFVSSTSGFLMCFFCFPRAGIDGGGVFKELDRKSVV